MKQQSRRSFLKLSALGGSALACMAAPLRAQGNKPQFNKVADVIVIGSGFAGLAAALEAVEQGRSVMLLEKMPAFGGNSAINGGAFAVAGSPLQAKEGIKDSPELMLQDMIKSGRGLSHVDLLKNIVYGTRPAFDFTVKYGVQYKPFVQHFGGHSVPRIMQTIESTGGGITRPLVEAARKLGVDMHLNCAVTDFVQDKDGRVIGVKVLERHNYEKPSSGIAQVYGARRGIIAAAGGFSQNVAFCMQQDPLLGPNLESTNHPGATGEVLQAMLALGALPVQLDQIQLGPWSSPDERGFGLVSQFNTIAGFPKGIMVDKRTGRRFVDELADRKARADAILQQLDENGKPVYPICFTDSEGAKLAQTLPNGLKYGVIKKFNTIGELADHYGIPKEALIKQVEEFNGYIRAKKDAQCGRPLDIAIEIKTAPFYAARVWPKVHYCMGGVGITKDAEVINVRTQQPIPGLYAAGEVTGGTHGASRLGGCAIADGLVTGRVAGAAAAKAPAADL